MDLPRFEASQLAWTEGVAELTLSRPKAANALNRRLLGELDAALAWLAQRSDLRVLILTGAGDKAFTAGADIAEMSTMSVAEAEAFAVLGHGICRKLEELPVPVLAAVNGFALGGGCELALACDIVYASTRAQLGQPEVKLGLMPGFGGTVRLARKVGPAVASEWIYTGERVDACAAKATGLVREVYEPDELLPRVREVARLIAGRALIGGLGTDLAAALALERTCFAPLFATEDQREGTKAFLEKREPIFKGV